MELKTVGLKAAIEGFKAISAEIGCILEGIDTEKRP
jgi:hypothetical protein